MDEEKMGAIEHALGLVRDALRTLETERESQEEGRLRGVIQAAISISTYLLGAEIMVEEASRLHKTISEMADRCGDQRVHQLLDALDAEVVKKGKGHSRRHRVA